MKNVKRIMSFLLAFILLYGATFNCIYAVSEEIGEVLKLGESNSIKTIGTLEELKAFRNEVNNGNNDYSGITVRLTANIDLKGIVDGKKNEEWISIGTWRNPFKGTFDGNGYKIYNLKDEIAEKSEFNQAQFLGFFGLCENATIKNLTVEGEIFNSEIKYVGSIVSAIEGGIIEKCISAVQIKSFKGDANVGGIAGLLAGEVKIENCSNKGKIEISGDAQIVGGIVGVQEEKTTLEMYNCENSGIISIEKGVKSAITAGGIIGLFRKGTISHCLNYGNITGIENNENQLTTKIGGIAGETASGSVTNCYNKGKIVGKRNVGGIVGYNKAEISFCMNEGEIQGTVFVGGIAGFSENNIKYCYNSNEAKLQGEEYIGGIVGETKGEILNCINEAEINNGEWIGGITGRAWKSVRNCSNTADITGKNLIGGIVGFADTEDGKVAEFNNCFNYGKISGQEVIGGIAGETFGYSIENCYNIKNGDSKILGSADVGGIAGIYCWENGTKISHCANNMNIIGYLESQGKGSDLYKGIAIGGIIGKNIGSTNGSGRIEVCKNLGDVYGKENVGGIIGTSDKFYYIKNSINDANVSGEKCVGGFLGSSFNEKDLDKKIINTIEASYIGEDKTVTGEKTYLGFWVGNCVNLKLISMPLQQKEDKICGYKEILDVSQNAPADPSNIINSIKNTNKENDAKLKTKSDNYSFLTNGNDNFKIINGKPILKIGFEEITFEDENFRKGIAKNLADAKIPYTEGKKTIIIKKEDISKIKELNVSSKNIESINGISSFTSLEKIDFSKNNIKYVSELKKLKNIKTINLGSNQITNIKDTLDELVKNGLMEAYIENNKIEDITIENIQNYDENLDRFSYNNQKLNKTIADKSIALSSLPSILGDKEYWEYDNCKINGENLEIIDCGKISKVSNCYATLEINAKVNQVEAEAIEKNDQITLNIKLRANPNLVEEIKMRGNIENYINLYASNGDIIKKGEDTYDFVDYICADSQTASEQWTKNPIKGSLPKQDVTLATDSFVYNVEVELIIDLKSSSLDISKIEIKNGLFYAMKGFSSTQLGMTECEVEKPQENIGVNKIYVTGLEGGIYGKGQEVTFRVPISDGIDLSNITKENAPTLKLYFQNFTENDTKYIASKNMPTATFSKVSGSNVYYTYKIQKDDVGIIRIKSYTGKINDIDVEYTGRVATFGARIIANATDNVVDEIVYEESIKINGEDAKATSRDVELTLKFDPTKTIGYYISENEDEPEDNLEVWTELSQEEIEAEETKVSYQLSEGDGEKTVYAWFKYDNGCYTSNKLFDTITLDTKIDYSLQIDGNKAEIDSRKVVLEFTGEMDCDQMLILEEKLADTTNILENEGWINFQNDYEYEIKSPEDGVKTIYVYLRKGDTVLNNSIPLEDQIMLKTDNGGAVVNNEIKVEKIEEKAFAINPREVEFDDGNIYYLSSDYTTNKTVTIKFYGVKNATKMFISDGTTAPIPDSDEGWEDYKEETTYTLSEGDGIKNIYVWFKNEAGKRTAWYGSSIKLDTKKPTIKVSKIDVFKDSTSATPYWSWNDAQENPGVVKFAKSDILKIQLKTDEENLAENYYLSTYLDLYNKENGEIFFVEGPIVQFDEKGESLIQIKYGEIFDGGNFVGMPEKFSLEWNYGWLRDEAGQMQDERESKMSFEMDEKAPEHIKTTWDFENGSQVGKTGDKIIFKSEYDEKVTNEILPELQVNFENGTTTKLTADKVEGRIVFYSYEATSEEQGEILSTNLIGSIKDIVGNVKEFTDVQAKTNLVKNAAGSNLASALGEEETTKGIYVDNKKPTIEVSKNGSEEYISQEEEILYEISDDYDLKSIEYVWKKVGDSSKIDYNTGFNYQLSKLADENPLNLPEEKGEYKLYLRVTDSVGNTQEMVSETYKIDEKTPTTNIVTSEKYTVKEGEVNYICEIAPETEKENFVGNLSFASENTEIKIYDLEGKEVTTGIVATGMKTKVKNGATEKEYILIVTGDVDSNGTADLYDIFEINKHRLKKQTLEDIYVIAGDVTGDGVADINDILKINKFRLGKTQSL